MRTLFLVAVLAVALTAPAFALDGDAGGGGGKSTTVTASNHR